MIDWRRRWILETAQQEIEIALKLIERGQAADPSGLVAHALTTAARLVDIAMTGSRGRK